MMEPLNATKLDLPKLTQDLQNAGLAARNAVRGVEDGGTCNFDALLLRFARKPSPKATATIEAAVAKLGLSIHWRDSRVGKGFIIDADVGGQAARRTTAAQAMTKYMEDHGWPCRVHYVVD